MRKFLILAALLAITLAHSTNYQVGRNISCFEPTPAKIYSWHIHILFWGDTPKSVAGALKVRDHFIRDFKDVLGEDCTDLFHQDHLCMFEIDYTAAGPFPTGQWAVFIPNENYAAVTSWALQNRAGYDLLIHPNSGCEVEDHTWWAAWSGTAWPLDDSIFGHDQPFPWPAKKPHVDTIEAHQQQAIEQSPLIKIFNEFKHSH